MSSSELKSIEKSWASYDIFPVGNYLVYSAPEDDSMIHYYSGDWVIISSVTDSDVSQQKRHNALSMSVQQQLMSDIPYRVL